MVYRVTRNNRFIMLCNADSYLNAIWIAQYRLNKGDTWNARGVWNAVETITGD